MDKILIIDDDETFNGVVKRALKRRGHVVEGATEPAQALATAREQMPDGIVLDLNLGGSSGLSLIQPLLEIVPTCRIVVLTGYASIATAVNAIKLGAVQYLAKPVDADTLLRAFSHSAEAGASPETVSAQPMSVDRVEWEHIQRVLRENDGNISATARALNMHRRTLQRKLLRGPVKS